MRTLENNLKQLCQLEWESPGGFLNDIFFIKAQLNELSQERYRGAIVRSRAEKFLLGEQPTKRALSGEHKYAQAKQINSIHSGPMLTFDKDVIQDVFFRHYKYVFGCDNAPFCLNNLTNMLSGLPTLPEQNMIELVMY